MQPLYSGFLHRTAIHRHIYMCRRNEKTMCFICVFYRCVSYGTKYIWQGTSPLLMHLCVLCSMFSMFFNSMSQDVGVNTYALLAGLNI